MSPKAIRAAFNRRGKTMIDRAVEKGSDSVRAFYNRKRQYS